MAFKEGGSPIKKGLRGRFSLKTDQIDSFAILRCEGSISSRAEAEQLATAAQLLLADGFNLVLDLAGLEDIATNAVSELVILHMHARAAECEICLAGVNEQVRSVLELTNVASLFASCPTVSEATGAFSRLDVTA